MAGPTTNVVTAISHASQNPIITAGASRIGTGRDIWQFFPSSVPILDFNALQFIDSLFNRSPYTHPTLNEVDHLANYLALSTCCHLLDGWRYLAQSALSLLSGARNKALHLAYYAELRGVLSILSGSGVGILNKEHFCITHLNQVEWFRGPTHVKAREALQAWVKIPKNASLVISCFNALNLDGLQWADACGAAASAPAIAEHWLADWSNDLIALGKDKDLRDQVSYRPDLRHKSFSPLTAKEFSFINQLSAVCYPDGKGGFENIDPAIIYTLCNSACKLTHGATDASKMQMIWLDVLRWCMKNGFTRSDAYDVINVMKSMQRDPSSLILKTADVVNTEAIGVISRAFLQLRIASALLRRVWQDIRIISPGGIAAWQNKLLNYYGVHSQLWDQSATPNNYSFLDADRISAQDEIEKWLRSRSDFSGFQMWQTNAESLVKLCRFERLGILAVAA